MSILVIEDDRELNRSMSDLLRQEGYAVFAAYNGEEAMAYLAAADSLILLDLAVPNFDEMAFRACQLANPRTAGIPIVVASGRPDALAVARKLGACDLLRKPFSLEELLHVVQNRAVTVVRADHFLRGVLRQSWH